MALRSPGVVRDQDSKASEAAATAPSTCASLASGISTMVLRVRGLMTFSDAPLPASKAAPMRSDVSMPSLQYPGGTTSGRRMKFHSLSLFLQNNGKKNAAPLQFEFGDEKQVIRDQPE